MLKTYLNDESIRDFKNIIKNEIEAILLYIKQNAIKINAETIEAEMIDVKDKPFYEIVLDGRIKDSKLITGNIKHFPSNLKIITLLSF